MTKYTTVEGHEIKLGERYELRDGKRAFITRLDSEGEYRQPICVAKAGYDSTHRCRMNGEHDNMTNTHDWDIMRPWKEKEEKPKIDDWDWELDARAGKKEDNEQHLEKELIREMVKPEGKPRKDEWIWIQSNDSGECPVSANVGLVEIRTATGVSKGMPFGYDWSLKGDIADILAYRIVEPKEEKKVYKLSEMWVAWFANDFTGSTAYRKGEWAYLYKQQCFKMAEESGRLIAITPADATEFYFGEGLDDQ